MEMIPTGFPPHVKLSGEVVPVVLLIPLPERARASDPFGEFHNHVLVDGRLGEVNLGAEDRWEFGWPGIELPITQTVKDDPSERRDS
jgi:hypothetical protein